MTYVAPPEPINADNNPRSVGVEIEFTGLSAEHGARILAQSCGGTVSKADPHEFYVDQSSVGQLKVTLDTAFAHPADGQSIEHTGLIEQYLRRVGGNIAETIVPVELVAPPVAFDDLNKIDELVSVLAKSGAKGTSESAFYAFGTHFNIEVSELSAAAITPILTAFALVEDWLRDILKIDLSRRLTTFIDPFPASYVSLLAAPDYAPPIDTLIEDYVEFNPTRNRALDMIPLFIMLDEPRVRRVIADDKSNARPTFHYRLPNSQLGKEGWTLKDDWSVWVRIEEIAANSAAMKDLRSGWHNHASSFLGLEGDWRQDVEAILTEHCLGAKTLSRDD